MSIKRFCKSFFLVIFISGEVHAEISISNLMESSRSVPREEQYDADYQFAKSNYHLANGPQLFYAAVVEAHLGNDIEALKYLIAGQIRSTTDMSLFSPATKSDEKLMADLYGMIFYQFGGAGRKEIYQDEAVYQKVLANIRSYQPTIDDSYNPGWSHQGIPSNSEYLDAVSKGKDHRLKQLTDWVSLLQNEEYIFLSEALEEIKKNPDRANEALDIVNRMSEISGAPQVPVPD